MLGVCRFVRAFFGCGEQELLFHVVEWASHCSGCVLWGSGSAAVVLVESSLTGDRTCVPCIGRQILYHPATSEVPSVWIFTDFSMSPAELRTHCTGWEMPFWLLSFTAWCGIQTDYCVVEAGEVVFLFFVLAWNITPDWFWVSKSRLDLNQSPGIKNSRHIFI